MLLTYQTQLQYHKEWIVINCFDIYRRKSIVNVIGIHQLEAFTLKLDMNLVLSITMLHSLIKNAQFLNSKNKFILFSLALKNERILVIEDFIHWILAICVVDTRGL